MAESSGLLPAEVVAATSRYRTETEQALEGRAEDHPEGVDRELLTRLGDAGLLQVIFGGDGRRTSAVELCTLREGIARASASAETAAALQGLGGAPIAHHATDAVRERWVPRVADGSAVAAFALTEPQAGSDAAALELRAEQHGDGWVLTGTKKWISNAPDADVYVVFARTDPDDRRRGVTAFVVPGDAEGMSGTRLRMLAPHPIGQLDLDGVEVPGDHVLGEVGDGFGVAMSTLDLFRPSVGAGAVGMAQAALEATIEHVTKREAFGRTLGEFQAVGHGIAQAATELEAARLLVHHAARAFDEGSADTKRLSAMAKLLATETGQRVIDTAVQFHGAKGMQAGHLLEGLYRDIRPMRIYEGASEIQREIIARQLLR